MVRAAFDNDVLVKLSAYRLLGDGLVQFGGPTEVGVLGAARFVVRAAIGRGSRIHDQAGALTHWEAVVDTLELLEPSTEEVELAADIEERAARAGLPLDTGESQLMAIVVSRSVDVLVTGDKRAIAAAEVLRAQLDRLAGLDGRIACLEQMIRLLIGTLDAEAMKAAVCREPQVDRALAICFGCASGVAFSADGLESYIDDVRRSAPSLVGAL